METEFNFKSQPCTSREQSERLLSLGLKKETADIVHYFSQSLAQDWTIVPLADGETARYIQSLEIPAWGLHRLIEMVDDECVIHLDNFTIAGRLFEVYDNLFDNIIDCIEWLIKEGYFNKEYLV